jgi:RimJ/RimL family protein N-acetyltransferase
MRGDEAGRRRVDLPDGRALVVRPAQPTDVDGLELLYAALSSDDLHLRFFSVYHPPRDFFDRMAAAADEGGCCLVAAVDDPVPRIVGEAEYFLLPNGNGELAITVAPDWRGWLGPYLLDALLEAAAAHGVPNLEAEVLVENRRMQAVLRRRGYATVDASDLSEVRLTVGTTGPTPTWPGAHARPRVLVEARGLWWAGEQAAKAAGMEVLVCPGPHRGARCPALDGQRCPLVEGADVVVCALPAAASGGELRAAHATRHATTPVVVPGPATRPGEFALWSTSDDALVGLLRRVIAHTGRGAAPTGTAATGAAPTAEGEGGQVTDASERM